MSSQAELLAANLINSHYGRNGGILLTDTTAVTGEWKAMIVLSDATFTTLTTEFTKNGVANLAVAADWGTLYEGTVFTGKITAVTLATGKVLLMK